MNRNRIAAARTRLLEFSSRIEQSREVSGKPPRSVPSAEDVAVGRVRRLLEAIACRPPMPPQLRGSDFLERVFEQALQRSAQEAGTRLLREALQPLRIPRDVTWHPTADDPVLAETLRANLPRLPHDLRPQSSRPRPRHRLIHQRLVAGVAAAMLVATGAFIAFSGTSRPAELVFVEAAEPLSPEHASTVLALLRVGAD